MTYSLPIDFQASTYLICSVKEPLKKLKQSRGFYPIEAPDPIEAIKFRMEQMNMDNQDLAKVIGYKSRVSEIFNRRRKLTLKMIRNLHEKMKIPYESLITDYK